MRNRASNTFKKLRMFFVACGLAILCACSAEVHERAGRSTSALDIRPNQSLGHPATQSSTWFDADPSRAVDGNTDGDFSHGSVTHTGPDPQAWWQVDLSRQRWIDTIEIYGRTDCCADRL